MNRLTGVVGLMACLTAIGSLGGPAALAGNALDEVNLQRTRVGLPPLVADPVMMDFAQRKAEFQAARGIDGSTPGKPYNGHEGPRNPGGWVEGTGVGRGTSFHMWATCAMDSVSPPGTKAGAGSAVGPDGARYQCLVVAGDFRDHPRGTPTPIVRTIHLNDYIPRVPARPSNVTPEPSGVAYSPRDYPFDRPPRLEDYR